MQMSANEISIGADFEMHVTNLASFLEQLVLFGILQVNEATLTVTDMMNINGVVHVIDKVLMPDPSDGPAEPLQKQPTGRPLVVN